MLNDYIFVSNIIPNTYCEKIVLIMKDENKIENIEKKYIQTHLEELYVAYCQKLFRANKNTPDILNLSEVNFDCVKENSAIENNFTYKPSNIKTRVDFPVLSFIGVFNDDYSGGTITTLNDTRIRLNAGDILVFPSNFVFQVELEKVTKGNMFYFTSFGY